MRRFWLAVIIILSLAAPSRANVILNSGFESQGYNGATSAKNWSGNNTLLLNTLSSDLMGPILVNSGCKLSGCILLEGTRDILNIGYGDIVGIPTGNTDRTIRIWINPKVIDGGLVAWGDADDDATQDYVLGLMDYSGTIYLFTDGINGANNITISGAEIPTASSWAHLMFIKSGSNWYYYLNGVQAKSGTFGVTIDTVSPDRFFIGNRSGTSDKLYSGKVDDTAIWSKALTRPSDGNCAGESPGAYEVCDDYNSGSGVVCDETASNMVLCLHGNDEHGYFARTSTTNVQRQTSNPRTGTYAMKMTSGYLYSDWISTRMLKNAKVQVYVRGESGSTNSATIYLHDSTNNFITGCSATSSSIGTTYTTLTISSCDFTTHTRVRMKIVHGSGTLYIDDAEISDTATANVAEGGVGNSAFNFPSQNKVWYDGEKFRVAYGYGSSASPKIVYCDGLYMKCGSVGNMPYAINSVNGGWLDIYSSFWFFPDRWLSASSNGAGGYNTLNVATNVTGDNAKDLTYNKEGTSVVATATRRLPSVIADMYNFAWVGAVTQSGSNNYVEARRASTEFNTSSSWDSPTTLSTTDTSDKIGQLIPFGTNGDIGSCYTEGTALKFKFYNSLTPAWGSAESVNTSTLNTYYSFRCLPTVNGKVFAIYRGSNDLYYRIRTAGPSGTWGTEQTLATDIYGTAAYFTGSVDGCRDETVYAVYYDGTNLVYKKWDGSSLGSKTTIETPAWTISPYIGAGLFNAEKLGFVYQKNASAYDARIVAIDIPECPRYLDRGILVTKRGNAGNSTRDMQVGVWSYGGKTFVSYLATDMHYYGNILDNTTETWDFQWQSLMGAAIVSEIGQRMWEIGQSFQTAIDGSGYIYIAYGGEPKVDETRYVTIKKSSYPLGDSNFDITKWIDISPYHVHSDRSYKNIIIDNNVLYLIHGFDYDGGLDGDVYISEFRDARWSSFTKIVEMNPATDKGYFAGNDLGLETSGQKSIHLFWGYMNLTYGDEQTPRGTTNLEEINYMKIIPDGSGGFTANDASGASLTLPATISSPYNVYYNGGSGGSGDFAKFNDSSNASVILDGNVPAVTFLTAPRTFPYTPTKLWFYKWSGASWDSYEVDTGSDWALRFSPTVEAIGGIVNGDLSLTSQKSYSGTQQIVKYASEDSGDSWSSPTQITSATKDVYYPIQTQRVSDINNLMYHARVHETVSEVTLDAILTVPSALMPNKPFNYPFNSPFGGLNEKDLYTYNIPHVVLQ